MFLLFYLTFVCLLDEVVRRKEEGTTLPTLSEVLEGRKLQETYSLVYSKFLPRIASARNYKEEMRARLEDPNNNSELFTHSDEAFTLVVLENYWDRWIDECKDGMPRARIGSRRKKEVKSNVEPKYTSGGLIYDDGKRQNPGKGWKEKGIKRYNELLHFVIEDRKKNQELFLKRFLDSQRKERESFLETRRPVATRERVIPISEMALLHEMSKVNITPIAEDDGDESEHYEDDDKDEDDDSVDSRMKPKRVVKL
jgi:hypothetical protein